MCEYEIVRTKKKMQSGDSEFEDIILNDFDDNDMNPDYEVKTN